MHRVSDKPDIISDTPSLPNPQPRSPLAVAIQGGAEGRTPHISATGRGELARQMLDIAFAHGVKVREDADLVEILAALDVDSDIPVEALAAVAEILSYVYRVTGRPNPSTEESAP